VITLRPVVHFSDKGRPDNAEVQRLHHEAHAACFLANSVKTEVRCEPVLNA
jgi:organic hydroperoxide reductase OsmC/OhrA